MKLDLLTISIIIALLDNEADAFFSNGVRNARRARIISGLSNNNEANWSPHIVLGDERIKALASIKQQELTETLAAAAKKEAEEKAAEDARLASIAKKEAEEKEVARLAAVAKKEAEEKEAARLAAIAKKEADEKEAIRLAAVAKKEAEEKEAARLAAVAQKEAEEKEAARLAAIAKKEAEEKEAARLAAVAKKEAEEKEAARLAAVAKREAEEKEVARQAAVAKAEAEEKEVARLAAVAKKEAEEKEVASVVASSVIDNLDDVANGDGKKEKKGGLAAKVEKARQAAVAKAEKPVKEKAVKAPKVAKETVEVEAEGKMTKELKIKDSKNVIVEGDVSLSIDEREEKMERKVDIFDTMQAFAEAEAGGVGNAQVEKKIRYIILTPIILSIYRSFITRPFFIHFNLLFLWMF